MTMTQTPQDQMWVVRVRDQAGAIYTSNPMFSFAEAQDESALVDGSWVDIYEGE